MRAETTQEFDFFKGLYASQFKLLRVIKNYIQTIKKRQSQLTGDESGIYIDRKELEEHIASLCEYTRNICNQIIKFAEPFERARPIAAANYLTDEITLLEELKGGLESVNEREFDDQLRILETKIENLKERKAVVIRQH